VYSLYIINKSGGLIFQKDLVDGLARLDTNEALTQASIWCGRQPGSPACPSARCEAFTRGVHAHRHPRVYSSVYEVRPARLQALAPCHLRAALSSAGLHWHAGAFAMYENSTTQLRAPHCPPRGRSPAGVRMLRV